MKVLRLTGVLVMIFALTACKTSKDTSDDSESGDNTLTTQEMEISNIEMSSGFMLPKAIDPITINSLKMVEGKEDILEIDVSYGGCGLHDFVLYGNRSYQKSLPPKLGLALIHDAHGDKCKKQTNAKLYFNIKEIRYPDKDEDYVIVVYVNSNSGKSVDYKY